MLRGYVFALAISLAGVAGAQDLDAVIDGHILPGYEALEDATLTLAEAAAADCTPESGALRTAFHDAFDAWVRVSHLRFGPSETDDRAFALAFWPDPRGSTQKTLGSLLRTEDDVIATPEGFATVSVAGRGFYALEFMLFDPALATAGSAEYRCALVQAITVDIASNSAGIRADWLETHADLMRRAGQNDTYRSEEEALRQLFTALTTGLEFTADVRLGRPLGTFDRPRPKRAEARRSERSLLHVVLSLNSLRELAALMSETDPRLDAAFSASLGRAGALNDPVFASVTDPQGRLRIEALQQEIKRIRQEATTGLGQRLGIAAGFNSLDGD